VNAHWLARLIVDEIDTGKAEEHGLAFLHLELKLPILPTTCSGGIP
jgi:hypothetical protein